MVHALAYGHIDSACRGRESGLGSAFVTGRERHANRLYERPDSASNVPIASRPLGGLTKPFLGGSVICHSVILPRGCLGERRAYLLFNELSSSIKLRYYTSSGVQNGCRPAVLIVLRKSIHLPKIIRIPVLTWPFRCADAGHVYFAARAASILIGRCSTGC